MSVDEKERKLAFLADNIQKFYRYKGYNTSENLSSSRSYFNNEDDLADLT